VKSCRNAGFNGHGRRVCPPVPHGLECTVRKTFLSLPLFCVFIAVLSMRRTDGFAGTKGHINMDGRRHELRNLHPPYDSADASAAAEVFGSCRGTRRSFRRLPKVSTDKSELPSVCVLRAFSLDKIIGPKIRSCAKNINWSNL
jgi:hypothetical protein